MLRRTLLIFVAPLLPLAAQFRPDDPYPKIHDPSTVMVEDGDKWCVLTGNGLPLLRQEADGRWKREAPVFREYPAWHNAEVPENKGHLWAPDILRIGDKWFVYYSVSSFGSFWEGISLVELDPVTGLRKDDRQPLKLAMHPEIEAPFIHKEGDWYYLFVNWGKCCRGVDSTYEIRVGRAKAISGPYLDKNGDDLKDGGGLAVLATNGRFIGPGHASIFVEKGGQMLVHHFYDKERRGRSDLRMLPLEWRDGWPVVK